MVQEDITLIHLAATIVAGMLSNPEHRWFPIGTRNQELAQAALDIAMEIAKQAHGKGQSVLV